MSLPFVPKPFIHDAAMPRVVFREGAVDAAADEVELLVGSRVLLISTRSARAPAERIASTLGGQLVGQIDSVTVHVPAAEAESAVQLAARTRTDLLFAIGGGSAVGLAKAVAKVSGLGILAIPTTFAGSEMTTIWGLSDGGVKTTGRDPLVLPRTVLYDPLLTLGLPPQTAAMSGLNALAHCVEALYADNATPVTSLMAESAVQALASGLPGIVADPASVPARAAALYGAWLAGAALNATHMGLHHKLCHVLAGNYNLPHAETHAVVLPHVTAWNEETDPGALLPVARALGSERAATGLWNLGERLGTPRSLVDIGFPADQIDAVAELVAATAPANPREVDARGVRQVLVAAVRGRRLLDT